MEHSLDTNINKENFNEPKGTFRLVMDYIKQGIRQGKLHIGSRLPAERTLAARLNISRNSVREAIRVMEIMGMLVSVQGAGHYISNNFENTLIESMSMLFMLKEFDFKKISELRKALEMQALCLAVENADEADLLELKEIEKKLDSGNYTEKENVMLDKRLHFAIARASGNGIMLSILLALSEVMDRFIADLRLEIMSDDERKRMLTAAHRAMITSIITKEPEMGLRAINDHFDLIDERLRLRKDDGILERRT